MNNDYTKLMKPLIITVVFLFVLACAPVITNFDECAEAGNPVMESYPRKCRTSSGREFVEEIKQISRSCGG